MGRMDTFHIVMSAQGAPSWSSLSLSYLQELCLVRGDPAIVLHPSSFPVLETLTFEDDTDISNLFSALFPDPSFFPTLKTLGFFSCVITEGFMEKLTRFSSGRKDTTSAPLHRVVIVHRNGGFPTTASIHELERHVPVVDVQFDTKTTRGSGMKWCRAS